MAMVHRSKPALAVVAGLSLMTAMPAGAQNYSDGYQFLQAVEKQDAAKAQDLLGWRPRPLEDTLVDCANSLIEVGAV